MNRYEKSSLGTAPTKLGALSRKAGHAIRDDRGAATAEYAIATMAAVGFAGLLVVIMRSDEIKTILFDLVKSALTFTNPNDAAPAN
jgi:Flp pilus assembly pilin Flp